jgi:tetratricopeptide (TPR) repeat protein
VVCLDVADLSEPELRQEVLKLRRRVRKLTALLRLALALLRTSGSGGAVAGVATFKELRAKFYGGQQYDFTEYALVGIATTALNAKGPDDALRYLQANLEYFARSSMTYQTMAQAKNAKGDKGAAIKDLEIAVQFDPQNAQAKSQLQQLKGQ